MTSLTQLADEIGQLRKAWEIAPAGTAERGIAMSRLEVALRNNAPALIAAARERDALAEKTCEAYQIIGALAHAAGLTGHPDVQRVLDYFSDPEARCDDILPWPREALTAPSRDVLVEALEEWKCPSCGGSKEYLQRDAETPSGTKIPCKVCEGSGLHPTARQALSSTAPRRTGELEEALEEIKGFFSTKAPDGPTLKGERRASDIYAIADKALSQEQAE